MKARAHHSGHLHASLGCGRPTSAKLRSKRRRAWITYTQYGRLWRLPVRPYKTTDAVRYKRQNLRSRSDFQRYLHLAFNLYDKVENLRHIAEVGQLLLAHFSESKNRTLWLQATARPMEEASALLSVGMYGLVVVWTSTTVSDLSWVCWPDVSIKEPFAMAAFRLMGRFVHASRDLVSQNLKQDRGQSCDLETRRDLLGRSFSTPVE